MELDAEVMLKMVRDRMAVGRGRDNSGLHALEELVITGKSSIAEISLAGVEAGKGKMTCEEVVEAARRIIEGVACGRDGEANSALEGCPDHTEPGVITSYDRSD
ncbi:hypothetical protein FRB93_007994 [Tulasnella sp. JGI-2019a]|nr:hypothetical protein FRB93_007994 [Tulasnella sp. JGI-2019a]